jgi:hypothetical protein
LLTTPSHVGDATVWSANATLAHLNYFWFGVLSKTTFGFAASGNSLSPTGVLPEGIVRVSSMLPNGTSSVKSLQFGGLSSASRTSTRALQLTNQLTWYTEYNKHAFKLSASVMRDDFRSELSPSGFGTFTYNSLSDLETAHPASFTRTLGATNVPGAQISGAVSLGDAWRPTDGLQVQYGGRFDGNRFLMRPELNAALLGALGVANDVTPDRVYVSPRVGMQWYYGSSQEVAIAPGGVRPPRAVIHAGVGVFQNMASAQLINGVVTSTGLVGSTQTITCVGTATPRVDWDDFVANAASIPDRCADGSAGTPFGTASPNVTLFDRGYRQPHSLRGAADWSGPVLDNRFVLGVQAILSSGRDQSGLVDLNLDPTVRFALPLEGGRPVYVDPNAIVPGTGSIAIAATRRVPAFQHVWDTRSAYRVQSNQATINLKPITASPWLKWEATYSLLDTRETFSGFASTTGNPFEIGTGPSLLPGRQTVLVRWYDLPLFDVASVSLFGRLTSGQRFTPMVAGDVNGDGVANDRAFIPDNPDVRTLMSSAAPNVRDCLQHQLNALATRGSCQGPWIVNSAIQIKLDPRRVGLPKRATVSLSLQNPAGLADLVLHGSNGLRGWGQDIAPDQNLLFVRGFDQATRRFTYDVNQRFGSTRPQETSSYSLPFVSLTVSIDVGVPRERQLLTQALDLGRRREGDKTPALGLAGLGLRSIPNPIALLLAQSDSLKFSRLQADSLAQMNKAFITYAESLWVPVGRSLASLPDHYSPGEAFARYSDARIRTVDFLLTLVPAVRAVLTSDQRRRIPPQIANFLDERLLRFLRTSSVGDASAFLRR